jgi:hypothetical protein
VLNVFVSKIRFVAIAGLSAFQLKSFCATDPAQESGHPASTSGWPPKT